MPLNNSSQIRECLCSWVSLRIGVSDQHAEPDSSLRFLNRVHGEV